MGDRGQELDGITESMDLSLSKLRETVKDRGHKELDMTERLLLSFFSLMSQFFASGGQSIGASVSASVLRNIQG